MNFRDLEYVIETAKTLSFSQAAENCNVSQPSLSAQIKKLEEELGTEIFIRTKRKVHLANFGAEFIKKAEAILKTRDEIYALAKEDQNPLEGSFHLGAILTVAPYLFPMIAQTIKANAPKITLSLHEGKTEDLIPMLLAGKLDAALLSLPTDSHIFESYSLFTEPFYVTVPQTHPLARKKGISPKDLDDHALLLLEDGHCFRSQALEVCQTSKAYEDKSFTASSLETLRAYVAAGNDMTLMPAIAKKSNDGLAYIPLTQDKFSREIGLVWRKTSHKNPQIEKLIKLMQPLQFF